MNNPTTNAPASGAINTINQVEGFDPSIYAIPYTDLSTGETRKRLPVMAQLAWFRLVYREGKIAVSVTAGKDCFVATARVYPSYKDPADSYLAEATASRGYDSSKPSVSPREWAQTAAVGIALRNAGFGLQFGAAGDDFSPKAPDELGVILDGPPLQNPSEDIPVDIPVKSAGTTTQAPPKKELTQEEQFQIYCNIKFPTKKHSGRTLGEVLQIEPSALEWLANRYNGNPEVSKAAKFICEYAVSRASA